MENVLKKFPEHLVANFMRIPGPERENVLSDADLLDVEDNFEPDEESIEKLDQAIRYKGAKIQLIKLMLEGMIEDDINDRVEAQERAKQFLEEYPISEVLIVYEEKFRAEAN